MPNETPKSKCCNASPQVSDPNHCSYCGYYFVARKPTPKQSLRNQWEQEADGHKPTETIYPPSKEQIAKQCACGLQAHPQPNCPAAKQPDEMPDMVYLAYPAARINSVRYEHVEQSPYIRKSIHDGGMSIANDVIVNRDSEITKLKSALKECVELLENVGTTSCGCESPLGYDAAQKLITSAKGLYE